MGRMLWISIALAGMVTPGWAQTPDTTKGRDSTRVRDTAVVLAPIEVIGSIIPTAGLRLTGGASQVVPCLETREQQMVIQHPLLGAQ